MRSEGEIMSISRLRMGTDGLGVSTLVGFFGCPLRCRYCINDHCHGKTHLSMETPRSYYTPEELIEVLRKDEIYYLMTGGGVVFGGGEPLLQAEFIHDVCSIMDSRWIRRIETSLNVPWESVERVIRDIDEWIIDIKDINPEIYKRFTGYENENVIENLLRLRNRIRPGSFRIKVRIPKIDGYNNSLDVQNSKKWVMENLHVNPEVFEYQTVRASDEKGQITSRGRT